MGNHYLILLIDILIPSLKYMIKRMIIFTNQILLVFQKKQKGNSKKIDGNYRAVIVDTTKNNVRVEDVTLKKVEKKHNNTDDSSRVDLSTQIQLKQIYHLLLDMKASQEFQINQDRNNSILPPFFSARTKVLQALNSVSLDEKIHLLNEANTYMEDSVSAIKADLISNKEEIIKRTKQVDYLYD